MTDDRRQEDFAQRLSRISHKRGGKEAPDRRQDTAGSDDTAPRKGHPLRSAIIWIMFFAVLAGGGFYGWHAMPPDMRNTLTTLVDFESGTEGLQNVPDAIVETSTMADEGPIYPSPQVAHLGSGPLPLTDIVTQVSLPSDDIALGSIIPIIRNQQCELRAVGSAEKIAGVRIENALLGAPLYAFSDLQLADQLHANVAGVTQGTGETDPLATLTGEKTSLDVLVTDTSAPLYLVLQNMGPGIVWNLQPAPDVEIAHVALIGSDYSGVANLPRNTTVEALLVGDFVPPHQYGADDAPRDCMVRPWRLPRADWIASLKSDAGSLTAENTLYSYTKGYEAYNRWFTSTLGVDAASNMVTARDAAHVLIGPVPPAPYRYRSLAGQDVHLMATDHLITGNAAARDTAAKDLHRALLSAAIGGDIATLDPPALERESP